MTKAASTGINLRTANVVINADLPGNPAVLEQRIARAHRMGQGNPVPIYNLVTAALTFASELTPGSDDHPVDNA